MSSEDDEVFARLESALSAGMRTIHSSEEFNHVSAHILHTLEAAALLYTSGYMPMATFLAITAIEELAKLKVGMFRWGEAPLTRRDDAMFDHREKHALGAGVFPVRLRSRLAEACGERETAELLTIARNGGLRRVREQSLYFERTDARLLVPSEMVPRELSKRILLLAIDEYDDEVSGWTAESYLHGERATALFNAVATAA
jgi:AbiV family abortive infection protein